MNRVSSMISTLQHEACVSPVCERKVVSLLMNSVGMGQIDIDLAKKVEVIFMYLFPKYDLITSKSSLLLCIHSIRSLSTGCCTCTCVLYQLKLINVTVG